MITIIDYFSFAGLKKGEEGAYGKIVLSSDRYVNVSEEIETTANSYLKQQREIVMNAFLTENQKQVISC